LKFSS